MGLIVQVGVLRIKQWDHQSLSIAQVLELLVGVFLTHLLDA